MHIINVSFLLVFVTFNVNATKVFQEQLNAFTRNLLEEEPVASYFIDSIQQEYPNSLLLKSKLLPQTDEYDLNEIRELYEIAQHCNFELLDQVSTSKQDEMITFNKAICHGDTLTPRWFEESNLIHPGGGSYASKYVNYFPEYKNKLQKYFHIDEREKESEMLLLGRLQLMSEKAIEALILGAKFILSNDELWIREGLNYRIYSKEQWVKRLEGTDLLFDRTSNDDICLTRIGNVCWYKKENMNYGRSIVILLVSVNIIWMSLWILLRWRSKQRLMKERMLILQILTHELRTPIASLIMTVESFRRKFDNLPENFYEEFRRLCEDSRRLKQLAEASKDYLQSDQQRLVADTIPSLAEWIRYICEEKKVDYICDHDFEISINVYWVNILLENLITNAIKYGKAPILVHASVKYHVLIIKVIDQGQLCAADWNEIRKPFVSDKGLGLGLTIVESMIRKMGGKLKLHGPPTTFIMEIPCDPSDVITS